jgi:type II secretory pathway component GspD/PulD (secretin)
MLPMQQLLSSLLFSRFNKSMSLVYGLVAFSLLASCGLPMFSDDDVVDGEEQIEFSDIPVVAAPVSFQEEYPYMRMTEHEDNTYSVLITVPLNAGQNVIDRIGDSCAYVNGENATASVKLHSKQGQVYSGPNAGKDISATFKEISDIVLVRGNEDELRGIFSAIDYWFNSAPQIEIQAEVFETSTALDNERGFVQSADPLFADNQAQTFLKAIGVNFGTSSNPSLSGGGLGMANEVSLFDSSFNLGGIVQVLQQEGFVDILSQPRIVTRSGATASVSSTEEIPYLNVTTVSLTGANAYSVAYKQAGVTLTVTPVLVGADTIHMVISVEVSRLGREYYIGSDAQNNPINIPTVNTRGANDIHLYVRNGQYVVIGGLKLKSEKLNENKVPFLGDIPILGWLFSSKETSEEETSVSFVIRPVLKKRPSIEPFGDYFDPFAEENLQE